MYKVSLDKFQYFFIHIEVNSIYLTTYYIYTISEPYFNLS